MIHVLKEHATDYDVAMWYVSDHGESLGENGLYLHGFPYAIAPAEQTHVPMLFWASQQFYGSRGISRDCVQRLADGAYSHDWIFHTLLSLFDIRGSVYREDRDLFAPCRAPHS